MCNSWFRCQNYSQRVFLGSYFLEAKLKPEQPFHQHLIYGFCLLMTLDLNLQEHVRILTSRSRKSDFQIEMVLTVAISKSCYFAQEKESICFDIVIFLPSRKNYIVENKKWIVFLKSQYVNSNTSNPSSKSNKTNF